MKVLPPDHITLRENKRKRLEEQKIRNKNIKTLLILLIISTIVFVASMFDANRISTMMTGILVILFSVATTYMLIEDRALNR